MPESSVENVSLKGKRALLVEDNELNMEIAQFILENENMLVRCAWNGKRQWIFLPEQSRENMI